MERITIQKELVMTNFTEHLNDTVLARNRARKTYHYIAKLISYESAKNIDREFFDVSDLHNNDGWSLEVNTEFLNNLEKGSIFEIGINLISSNNYSGVSKNYFVVLENDEETITVLKTKTPNIAFKEKLKLFN